MDELNKIRAEIDAIDQRLIEALSSRRKLAHQVIETKNERGMQLRDEGREGELLAELIARGRKQGLDAHYITRVFHEVIDDSLRLQQRFLIEHSNSDSPLLRRVAFQGIEGAYSDLAAKKYFSQDLDNTTFLGYPTFIEVVDAVEEGKADCAFLPVENTTAGSINEVYDLLSRSQLSIVGEEVFAVDHCLLALPGASVGSIRRILSHPMAIAQCMKFISNLKSCAAEPYADTAMAVRKVAQDQEPAQAAIASEEAGRNHGLKVLKRHLADQRDNYTRFLLVTHKPIQVDLRIPAKTSLILATPHEEGALLRALSILHEHQINLTKLESRPRRGMPFQYSFYIDFEGNLADPQVDDAVRELRSATSSLKVLGCYPIEQRSRTMPSIQSRLPPTADHSPEADSAAPAEPADASEEEVSYKLASRKNKPEDTVIQVGNVRVGGPEFIVIAGPCSVESREQVFACAHQVKECGGMMLRGGCFKPRTSPDSFQGLGYEGLQLLAAAGKKYELPIVTEVLAPADVEGVAEIADILQVGARNMQNFSLLNEVGQSGRPVLLKRGMMATIEEFLNAAEYILRQGNHEIMLCERGIRTFESTTRNTLDLGAVPLLKRLSHLPVLVDPSHAAGQRSLVKPLALAARAVGPHGMMVEIHPDPDKARSDGPQALTFEDFADLMRKIYRDGRAFV